MLLIIKSSNINITTQKKIAMDAKAGNGPDMQTIATPTFPRITPTYNLRFVTDVETSKHTNDAIITTKPK